MRFRISTILCLTLFALTHSAPSKRVDGDSAKKDDQAPALDQPQDAVAPPLEQGQGQDAFDYLPQDAPTVDDMQNDCCAPGPQCMNPCQAPAAPPQAYNINFAPPAPPMPPPPPPPVYTGSNCCPPSPTCANPCPPQAAQIPPALPPPPPMLPPMQPPMQMAPPPMMPAPYGAPMGAPCCDPSVVQQCANPCGAAAPPAGDEGEERQTYQPYPGEITFKLMEKWHDDFLDEESAAHKILKGNVEKAIKVALGDDGDAQAPMNDYMNNPYGYPGYGDYYQQQQPKVTVSNIYFREGYVPGNPSTMPITVAHVIVNGGSDDASKLQALVTPDGSLGDGLKVYKDSFSAY